ncbi:hypothetical protein PPL_06847 [Heterostelium album PN500]|uniref:Uncharacterized protein n=1 Tax=Heterostelium pallidum (strain ATCC 26659 / Pp 5 / PN500) TaxID=670386 RepID=D3BDP5_HETP5|nr:hypothetical protein PPL_06847 [Heterostelium album PN500]EFA80026.1 hypothetical protein PPL_06847 [Heterostelium album PN500]|eukprot:XP_020432146.1 hypothetical protein PPL_06847 [Heterostelium album PN500]
MELLRVNEHHQYNSDSTDLIPLYPKTDKFYYISQSSGIIPVKTADELVFQSQGNIEGQIHTFNSKSKLSENIKNKLNIESLSTSVGRIFILCLEESRNQEYWVSCSGFCVSQDIVVSSALKDSVGVTKKRVYIYFGVDATVGEELDLDDIEDNPDVYELKTVKRNDQIEFFRFSDEDSPPNVKYLLPTIAEPSLDQQPILIGFPTYTNMDDFRDDFSGDSAGLSTSDIDGIYRKLSRDTRGFQRRIVSISKTPISSSDSKTIKHKCNTLYGMTGGALATGQTDYQFIGIHLEGLKSEQSNIALSVTSASFFQFYKTYVLSNNSFLKRHGSTLQSYIDHCQKLNL